MFRNFSSFIAVIIKAMITVFSWCQGGRRFITSKIDTPYKQHALAAFLATTAFLLTFFFHWIIANPKIAWMTVAAPTFGALGSVLWLLIPWIKNDICERSNARQRAELNDPENPDEDIEVPFYGFDELREISETEFRLSRWVGFLIFLSFVFQMISVVEA